MGSKTNIYSVFTETENVKQDAEFCQDVDRCGQLAELGTIGKAFSVLETVLGNSEPTTTAGIIRKTGVSKPTAYRIVNLLVDIGFLEQNISGGGLIEGANLVDLAHRMLTTAGPRALRHSILQILSDEISETCNYGILDGGVVTYLDRVEAKWPLGLRFAPGSRVPAHCTAIGKLLLSYLPHGERGTLLNTISRSSYTAGTMTKIEMLNDALKIIHNEGIGTDDQEFMHGVVCVAVPVICNDGHCVGGVSVSAPEARITLNEALRFVPQMKKAAARLTATFERTTIY